MKIINERIKSIRNALKMKQSDFAKELTISQGHLSDIENGRKDVTNKIQEIIILKFNVNEEWLRNGNGEMFIDPDTFVLEEYAKSKGASEYEISIIRKFVKNFFNQPEEVRDAIISTFLSGLKSNDNDVLATKEENFEDYKEKELTRYALELEAEHQGKTLSVSEKQEGA